MHWVTNLLSILNCIQLEAIEQQMSEKEASWYPNDATCQHICRVWFSASQSRNTLLSTYTQYLKDGIILPTLRTWQQNKPFCESRSPMYLFNDEVLDLSASTSYLGPTSRYTDILEANQLWDGFSVRVDSKPRKEILKRVLSSLWSPWSWYWVQPTTQNRIC